MHEYVFSLIIFLFGDHSSGVSSRHYRGTVQAHDYVAASEKAWQAIAEEMDRLNATGQRVAGTAEFRIDRQPDLPPSNEREETNHHAK